MGGPHKLTSYLDLTNSQSVNGAWSFDTIKPYIKADKFDALRIIQFSGDQSDISTVTGIVLLQDKFGDVKQDWSVSADKAWDSMSFSSRIAARTLIQKVISVLGVNLSVFDIVM